MCAVNSFVANVLVFLEERRRSQGNSFNDANQLFFGNVPLAASEPELKKIFQLFGQVTEIRIHNKGSSKPGPPGSRGLSNYGFVTYESQQGVQRCLAEKVSAFYLIKSKIN